ncbi:MAG: hypothetical protein ACR2O5_05460 [Thiogranum sp.]
MDNDDLKRARGAWRLRGQAGGFYRGCITGEIVGPFKGEHDSSGW